MAENSVESEIIRKVPCMRFAKNGEKAIDMREPQVIEMWVRFNKDFRPESALYVDGEQRSTGAFTQHECEAIAAKLLAKASVASAPTGASYEMFALT